MDQAVDEFDRARGKMAGDFKTMITDSEELLKAAATVSGAGFTAARSKFEDNLRRAKATLADASQPVVAKARQADHYVHGSPWTAIGAAVALGAVVGFLVAKR